MKTIITITLIFLSSITYSQHTIFPKNGLAISCYIEKVSGDTIYYYPEWAVSQLNYLSLKNVKHYTYNIIDSSEQIEKKISLPAKNIEVALKQTDSINYIATVENEWYYVGLAGQSIKRSLYWRLASLAFGTTTLILAPNAIAINNIMPIYLLAGITLTSSIMSIIEFHRAGVMLENASLKNRAKIDSPK